MFYYSISILYRWRQDDISCGAEATIVEREDLYHIIEEMLLFTAKVRGDPPLLTVHHISMAQAQESDRPSHMHRLLHMTKKS